MPPSSPGPTRSAPPLTPLDLIATARRLARPQSRRPRQADLRRAVSTAYYAGFHALAKCCADCLVGARKSAPGARAWAQTYRALQHGEAGRACRRQAIMARFPPEIQDFANCFVTMQGKREDADYNPLVRYTLSEVVSDIRMMEDAIRKFQAAPVRDRRAFAAFVLFRDRT